jgi:predicted RNase H-like nuclease (RuvC/YqgF family)
VRVISTVGIPVLIAADTRPPSHFVSKIAARLNVRVFSPSESMSRMEKRQIGASIDDVHTRDAYAAAVKAYRRYANRLRQIDKMDVEGKAELKKMVIIGQRISDAL